MQYLRVLDVHTLKRVHISESDLQNCVLFQRARQSMALRTDEAFENEEKEVLKQMMDCVYDD